MSAKKSRINSQYETGRGKAMKRNVIIKLAISAAIVAVPTAGCASISGKQSGVSSTADAGMKKAAKWAAKAEKYMASGDIEKSVLNAEKAVEADFRNSAYRAMLARGYIAQGRFVSAERTLQDVLDLGQNDPRTVISLALLRTSQGKTDSAISMLDSYRNILPAGDYGLALAVAGDNQRAVTTLEESVRVSDTAQDRQNLALAYALNGQWREARIMAGQDLNGTQVNENIQKWAQYARPDAYQERVAGLLGVSPTDDSGQPVRLALDSRSNANIDLAATSPSDSQSVSGISSVASNAELPAIGPAPVSQSTMPKTPAKAAQQPASLVDSLFAAKEDNVKIASSVQSVAIPASKAPVISAPQGPAKVAASKLPESRFIIESENASPSAPKAAPAKPVKLALADTGRKTNARSIDGDTYMIQLGAFSSTKNANEAWNKITAKHGVLKSFESESTVINANGRQLYRLSAMGFGNEKAAADVCSSIKANGGSCIVRKNDSKSPVRLASR